MAATSVRATANVLCLLLFSFHILSHFVVIYFTLVVQLVKMGHSKTYFIR